MSKYSINLRPHHMLCLQFFEGKGYSPEFIENMYNIKRHLDRDNPAVQIVQGADSVCSNCPNRDEAFCQAEQEIVGHDSRVLAEVRNKLRQLSESEDELICNWNDITVAINEYIVEPNKVKDVCVQCKWSDICFEKSKKIK